MQFTLKEFYSRALGIGSGLLLGAVLSLFLYAFMVREQWKKINNSYLKTTFATGMAVLGITISPLMMLIFGFYGARLGGEMGAEKFFNLIRPLFDPPADKKSASSEEAQSSTELAFLLRREQISSSSPAATAKIVVLPASTHSSGMFAHNTSATTRRSTHELQINTRLKKA